MPHPFDRETLEKYRNGPGKSIKYFRYWSQNEDETFRRTPGACLGLSLLYSLKFHEAEHEGVGQNHAKIFNNNFWKDGESTVLNFTGEIAPSIKSRVLHFQQRGQVFDPNMNLAEFNRVAAKRFPRLGMQVVEEHSLELQSPQELIENHLDTLLQNLKKTGIALFLMRTENRPDGHAICMNYKKIANPAGPDIHKISFFESNDIEVISYYSDSKEQINLQELKEWLAEYFNYFGSPQRFLVDDAREGKAEVQYELRPGYKNIKILFGKYINPMLVIMGLFSDKADSDEKKSVPSVQRKLLY